MAKTIILYNSFARLLVLRRRGTQYSCERIRIPYKSVPKKLSHKLSPLLLAAIFTTLQVNLSAQGLQRIESKYHYEDLIVLQTIKEHYENNRFLLVSDLHKTVNNTDSGPYSKIVNIGNFYTGVTELLRGLHNSYSDDLNLFILTNTPEKFIDTEAFFLDHFPPHTVYSTSSFSKVKDKFERLEELWNTYTRPMILIGDNDPKSGREDFVFYEKFRKKFPLAVVETYIHMIHPYVNDIPRAHILYITPFDIAYNEYLKGRISEKLALKVGGLIIEESNFSSIIHPNHFCPTERNFFSNELEISSNQKVEKMKVKINTKIRAHCREREDGTSAEKEVEDSIASRFFGVLRPFIKIIIQKKQKT